MVAPAPSLSTRGTVLTTGFFALDVILHGSDIGHAAGGTAGNVAANLAFLGWKAAVAGTLGDDPAGRQVLNSLRQGGVVTDALILRDGVSTPVVVHEISDAGHRFRFGCPQCGRRFSYHRPLTVKAAKLCLGATIPDVLFFDRASSGALWLAEEMRAAGKLVVFEPAGLGDPGRFQRALSVAHLVKFSHDRARRFEQLIATTPGQVQVCTLGEAGVDWRRGASAWKRIRGYRVAAVVDAGGAGDWMTAGILSTLQDLNPKSVFTEDFGGVLRVAQSLASISCGAVGARGLSRGMSSCQVRQAVTAVVARETHDAAFGGALQRAESPAHCAACLA